MFRGKESASTQGGIVTTAGELKNATRGNSPNRRVSLACRQRETIGSPSLDTT